MGAFKDCTSLQTIDIPDSVRTIGSDIFQGCTSLQTINCQIKSLENVEILDDTFSSSLCDSATLIVPSGTIEEYRSHPFFGKFKNIEINRPKSSKDKD